MTDVRIPTLAETYMRADYTGDSPRRLQDHRRMSHNAGLLAVYNLGVQHGKDHRAEAGDGASTTNDPAPSGSGLSNLIAEWDQEATPDANGNHNGGGFAMTNWERIKRALEASRFDTDEADL